MLEEYHSDFDENDSECISLVAALCEMTEVNLSDILSGSTSGPIFEETRDRARSLVEQALLKAGAAKDPVAQEFCHIHIGECIKVAIYDPVLLGLLAWLRTEYAASPLAKRLF